jgi:hypothetical protein
VLLPEQKHASFVPTPSPAVQLGHDSVEVHARPY